MYVHQSNSKVGFGNVLCFLEDYLSKMGMDGVVHENIKDFERGRAFDFNLKLADFDGNSLPVDLYCNPSKFANLSRILPEVMKPSAELLAMYKDPDAPIGIHIRCGSAMPDCSGLSAAHGGDWFATEKTFEKINEIIEQNNCKIFLISDSRTVKSLFKNRWGDRIVVWDTDVTLSCDPATCGGIEQTSKSIMDTYLEWYALSQCRAVVTTSGPGFNPETNTGAGLSTFGYTAAAYGRRPLLIVNWEGSVLKM